MIIIIKMCDYIYEDGPRKGLKCNVEHCEFHNHVVFSNKSVKDYLYHGSQHYKDIVDWIRSHPENIKDDCPLTQDMYGCGSNDSSSFILLNYLLSIENDKSCIIGYEGGKWYNKEYMK